MTMATMVKQRSLLGLKELSKEEMESILNRAAYWEARSKKIEPVLQG
jgi:aspartate carbamoyltransferase catalytic subunit